MSKKKLKIFDTTLRDGEQTPGVLMTAKDKLELAKRLEKLGVDIIEAGFPASSKEELKAVAAIARQVRKPVICALARAVPSDIEAAWEAVKEAAHPRIHIFLSSSNIHLTHQLRKSKEQVIQMAVEGVKKAKNYFKDIEFSAMDATRTEPKYLYQIIEAVIQAGATTINIPDTVGYGVPSEFAGLIKKILNKRNVPSIGKVVVSVHCHDDLGMAVANSLEAVKAGAQQVEVCVNGIGERAGNAALEEVVMALKTRNDQFKVETNIDTTQFYAISRFVEELTNIPVPPNKAIVGRNAFRHESGIHQDGVIKYRTAYEIMDPQQIGRPTNESSLTVGKTSGRNGVYMRVLEMGYKLTKESIEFERVYQEIKVRTNTSHLSEGDFKQIIESVLS